MNSETAKSIKESLEADSMKVWAEFEKEDKGSVFRPVPRDRDQAFVKFEGLLPSLATSRWAMRKMNHFGHKIKDMRGMTMQAEGMDNLFLNKLT